MPHGQWKNTQPDGPRINDDDLAFRIEVGCDGTVAINSRLDRHDMVAMMLFLLETLASDQAVKIPEIDGVPEEWL